MSCGAIAKSVRLISCLSLMVSGLTAAIVDAQAPENTTGSIDDRAANITVAPLRLELEGANSTVTLRLNNPSSRKIGVQLRMFVWSQENGQDVYAPTSDVLVSPAITSIAPGDTQIFRVTRTTAVGTEEKRYRVAIDQLPDPELNRNGEFQPRLRFTIPVFVDRAAAAPAQLAWGLGRDELRLTNSGGQTVKVLGVQAVDASGRTLDLQRNGLRYALGSAAITWPFTNGCPKGPVTITATVDGQAVRAEASPSCN